MRKQFGQTIGILPLRDCLSTSKLSECSLTCGTTQRPEQEIGNNTIISISLHHQIREESSKTSTKTRRCQSTCIFKCTFQHLNCFVLIFVSILYHRQRIYCLYTLQRTEQGIIKKLSKFIKNLLLTLGFSDSNQDSGTSYQEFTSHSRHNTSVPVFEREARV